jgi:hypothetical protein
MSVDIFSVKPHVVSRDLKGYTVLLYGQPKTGKTTIASQFPNSLLLAFETGFLTLPGVMALPINSWSDFKSVLRQLKSDEAHEMYDNIILDTTDIAYDLCEKFICNKESIENIGDAGYGKGYNMAGKEFDEALRSIPQMGYGLVMISHAQDKVFTDENGVEYNQICPTLSNRPRLIVDRMCDIIGYAQPFQAEDGIIHTNLYMRQTPRFVAGSRFKYTPDVIDFNYDALVKAIGDAIGKQAAEYNNEYVTDAPVEHKVEKLDFNELLNQFNDLVGKIQSASGSAFGTIWAPRIVEITDRYLGKGKKVNDLTSTQVEQLSLVVEELAEQVGNGI